MHRETISEVGEEEEEDEERRFACGVKFAVSKSSVQHLDDDA